MAPDGSGRVKVDLGADPDIYLARVDWTPDGNTLLVQRESRDQKRLDMLSVDPANGRSRVLFSETSPTWLNLHDNLRALRDGSLIWTSERSGFSHIYRFRNGRWTQLTRGNWAVDRVVGVDERGGRIYFTGNRETPLEHQLYWIDLARGGTPHRVTETGWWNAAEMDDAATHALVTRSSPTQPSQVYLADSSGRRTAWIEENRLDKLAAAIETGTEDGMLNFNQSLFHLVKEGKISQKEALAKATNPQALEMNFKGIFLDEGRRILG